MLQAAPTPVHRQPPARRVRVRPRPAYHLPHSVMVRGSGWVLFLWRVRYEISAKDFSVVAGLGKQTVLDYEKGLCLRVTQETCAAITRGVGMRPGGMEALTNRFLKKNFSRQKVEHGNKPGFAPDPPWGSKRRAMLPPGAPGYLPLPKKRESVREKQPALPDLPPAFPAEKGAPGCSGH